MILAANRIVRKIDRDSAIYKIAESACNLCGEVIMVKRDKVFQTIDHIILFLVSLFCVLPLILLFSSSFSNETAILHEGYHILPRQFDLTAYKLSLIHI